MHHSDSHTTLLTGLRLCCSQTPKTAFLASRPNFIPYPESNLIIIKEIILL